jgi:polysaccharide deacetylase 2 family uncharacterized protein YibQ
MEVMLEIKKMNNKNDTIRFLNEVVKMAKQNTFSILIGTDKNTIKIIK